MSCAPEVGAICCIATLVHAGVASLARHPEQKSNLAWEMLYQRQTWRILLQVVNCNRPPRSFL